MRSPRSGPLLCGSSRSGRHLGPLPRGLRSTPPSPRSLWPPSPSTVAVLGLPVSVGTSLRWRTGPPGRPPQERRASGDRWPGAARGSRQRLGELGPRAPFHTSPRAPAPAPSRDVQGGRGWSLGPRSMTCTQALPRFRGAYHRGPFPGLGRGCGCPAGGPRRRQLM